MLLLALLCYLAPGKASAQKLNVDSLQKARKAVLDSTRAEQKRRMDSTKAARTYISDSLKASRKRVSDSIGAIRKYRDSKKYKDSVAHARQAKVDSIRNERTAFLDSIKAERNRIIDSTATVRKRVSDSIKSKQTARADSLGTIRKYRESKRYKDSVAFVRQNRVDSLREARKVASEQLAHERKQKLDSAKHVRMAMNDSLKAVRTKYMDSIKAVRTARADSLTKMREKKDGLAKSRAKLSADKKQLAFELKIKQKREAWTNDKMLKKKWTLKRKVIQNTFTRYNYFFNANRKMEEALENMRKAKKENYDSLLALFPFDPDKDSSLLAPDMDSIVQKASVGIQIHDPRTKWGDNLYLLMGQAYYYKGNYNQAIATFKYIISLSQQQKAKEAKDAASKGKKVKKDNSIIEPDKNGFLQFLKHESSNNDAVLWLARTFTEAHKENDAESVLDLISNDKNTPDELKGRIALEKAYLSLGRNDYKEATGQLTQVANEKSLPDWLRLRAAYLNGQLQYERAQYGDAANSFQQAIDLKPKIDMDFYARKNLAYSLMQQGGNQESATASLRHMLKDGKYVPYYEQVYYVLGRLSANNNDYNDAIKYLKLSVESAKTTRKQKAISFASLGNVYYQQKNYSMAKFAYDSAGVYAKAAPDDSSVVLAVARASVLDKVMFPIQVVNKQDSLLRLAAMTDKEQRTVVKRYLRYLEEQREDSIARAEQAAQSGDQQDAKEGGTTTDWYFSNPTQITAGQNDFKRKWGARPNADNWRRSSAVALVKGGGTTTSSGGTDAMEEEVAVGKPTEEGLLAAIPRTPEKQSLAHQKIQKAFIDMANAYVNDLKDYNSGLTSVDTLDNRYKVHDYKAEALYIRYRIAMEQNRLADAQTLSEQLLHDHINSPWAKNVAPTEELKGLMASADPVGIYYDKTYDLVLQRDYGTALQRVRDGQRQYKDPVYAKRFTIIEAMALAGSGEYGKADTMLTDFISKNPKDTLKPWAETVKEYVKRNKPVDTTKPVDTVKAVITKELPPAETIPAEYTYSSKEPHYVLFYFTKMESKTMGLKAGFGDYNVMKYSAKKLDVNLSMLQPNIGLIVIKQFDNEAQAKIYVNGVRSNEQLMKEYKPDEYQFLLISAKNFRKLEADKAIQPYLQFHSANYK